MEIHPRVALHEGDFVVTKHRYSAFPGTDLDMIQRAGGIDTLVLAGISTSGVVLSTMRHAADADHRIVVVAENRRGWQTALESSPRCIVRCEMQGELSPLRRSAVAGW